MSDAVLVDTNVLVYVFDGSAPEKRRQAIRWTEFLWRSQRGRVSTQVLHELYAVLTRKKRPVAAREEARAEVRRYLAWRPIAVNASVIEGAWDLQDRFALSWGDALIVAAARDSGCRHLLTEDLQDGQDLDGVEVVDPFRRAPSDL
ncbi:MAG: PIN domain-containing protein [Myxococcales bacterium]|nr:PIN domain-containing protein [Myxococcales bacterium]